MADIRATKDCFLKLLQTTNIYDEKLGLGERGGIRGADKLFANPASGAPKRTELKDEVNFKNFAQDQQL